VAERDGKANVVEGRSAVDARKTESMADALARVAPGTPLREGLDSIVAGKTGALIVVGEQTRVAALCDGGFSLDTPFTPQRLFELAKMDGAIVLDANIRTILRANVHLQPDSRLPATETGMRHRTAERVARQTGALVISVSQRRDIVTLYLRDEHRALEDIRVLLARADQALQTLQRYRTSFDAVAARLTGLEFEDLTTLADVVAVVARGSMVARVAAEVSRYIGQLGTEGRLVRMQAVELAAFIEDEFAMLLRDYTPDPTARGAAATRLVLAGMGDDQLMDPVAVEYALGYPGSAEALESHVVPRGYRVLRRVPGLRTPVIGRIVDRFGTLPALMAADPAAIDEVDGVGARRAKVVHDGLRRLRDRVR
jgi:diadenylate cyclase